MILEKSYCVQIITLNPAMSKFELKQEIRNLLNLWEKYQQEES
jgi:cobalamin biosynthesis Mg chelatase CobN